MSAAAAESAEGSLATLLTHGHIEPFGRLTWSSNYALLARVGTSAQEVEQGGTSAQQAEQGGTVALYKPERGERALWDFPQGLWRREVAAYELSEALGWHLVPPTVARFDGPLGPGSLQLWLECDYDRSYFTEIEEPDAQNWLRRLAIFDLVANNADRKGGHVLVTTAGERYAIDHGLCFHELDKLRTVAWDFVGESMPTADLEALAAIMGTIEALLAPWLLPAEVAATRDRIGWVLAHGEFPAPFTDPPYPWPLL